MAAPGLLGQCGCATGSLLHSLEALSLQLCFVLLGFCWGFVGGLGQGGAGEPRALGEMWLCRGPAHAALRSGLEEALELLTRVSPGRFRLPPGCSSELNHLGYQFLQRLFEKHDKVGNAPGPCGSLAALCLPLLPFQRRAFLCHGGVEPGSPPLPKVQTVNCEPSGSELTSKRRRPSAVPACSTQRAGESGQSCWPAATDPAAAGTQLAALWKEYWARGRQRKRLVVPRAGSLESERRAVEDLQCIWTR